ncbi:MAG: TATA-box-binding protein [Promethearchaeota archaeon]|nr:MAG: TATA-box-binding protein [Candidatus Lokiarchaeota archaeon]
MSESELKVEYKINNVVATVYLDLSEKLDLVNIARKVPETEYNPEKFPGLVFRLDSPRASFLIFSTGSMVVTGLKNVKLIDKAVSKLMKILKGFGLKLPEPNIKIQNFVASGDLHIPIDLNKAVLLMEYAMYEPEVFPGLIYHMKDPKAVFLIFSTGKIVCTGVKNEEMVKKAILKLNRLIHELQITIQNTFEEEEYEEIVFL